MGINYRCNDPRNCGRRVTLKKPIDHYRVRPMCPGCKQDRLKSVNSAEKARNKVRGCFCRGNGWPHNKGAIVDENRTCVHANLNDLDLLQEVSYFGGEVQKMKGTDPCPF